MRALNRSAAAAILLVVCSGARAAIAQCSWATQPPGIAFGAYSVFGSAGAVSTTSGTIRCTGSYNFSVSLSKGGSGSYTPRKMNNVAAYNVYVDAAQAIIYGDGTGGTFVYTGTNAGGTNSYGGTVYGGVPAAQDLAPGSYTDSLTATLSYQRTSGGAWTVLPGVTVKVSMSVAAECRADTFNLNFGNYNPLAVTALNQSSQVKVYCTKTTPATLSMDNGANALGVQKRMIGGAVFLNYSAALATGSATSTSSLVPLGGGIALNGSIPAAQDARIGSYTDTLQVVVNY